MAKSLYFYFGIFKHFCYFGRFTEQKLILRISAIFKQFNYFRAWHCPKIDLAYDQMANRGGG